MHPVDVRRAARPTGRGGRTSWCTLGHYAAGCDPDVGKLHCATDQPPPAADLAAPPGLIAVVGNCTASKPPLSAASPPLRTKEGIVQALAPAAGSLPASPVGVNSTPSPGTSKKVADPTLRSSSLLPLTHVDSSLAVATALIGVQVMLRLRWRRHLLDTLARVAVRQPPGTLVQLDAEGVTFRMRTSQDGHART